MASQSKKALIVSHPCVVPANQAVYRSLQNLGWEVTIVVPSRWRHEYSTEVVLPEPLEELEGQLRPTPVVFPGRPGRHFYRAQLAKVIEDTRPVVAFVEAETFSIAGFQWSFMLHRSAVPFGIQGDENVDRPLPRWVKLGRARVLQAASFVGVRSPAAAAMIRHWGGELPTPLIPHAVPLWANPPRSRRRDSTFTVGFAGRLTAQKGIDTLVSAVERLAPPVRLILAGNGDLAATLRGTTLRNGTLEVRSDLTHDQMPVAYGEMDVLVLPSRTERAGDGTILAAEQFGRVLAEALWCGVPVIGSDTGEIPWTIETTGGGLVFPEGDAAALAASLGLLRSDPVLSARFADRGRERVGEVFSEQAAARALGEALIDAISTGREARSR